MKKVILKFLLGRESYNIIEEVIEDKIDLLHYNRVTGEYYSGLDATIEELYKLKNKYFEGNKK